MATQNANNVAITSGTINNTVIGGTTPAASTFTTLTATSTATLGGDATNPSLVAAAVSGSTRWLQVSGSSASNVVLSVQGIGTPALILQNRSTGAINFTTNGSATNVQLAVSHTASAVNYVQVTGAATTAIPTISAQGNDANPSLGFTAKGTGSLVFFTNSSAQRQFRVSHTASAVNYLDATGSAAGSAPVLSVVGNDTDIDLTLTPKGAGNVRFGTYTASALLAVAGYITIKDSGGTTRRLLVG